MRWDYIMRVILSILITAAFTFCLFAAAYLHVIKHRMELAYFEGQRDAMEGDVRISQLDNGCYVWITSPWNDGDKPSFYPPICKP